MNYVESFNLLGREVKQIPNITGAGAPTISTEGAVGCQYMDTLSGDIYKCTAVEDGVYTWILTTPVLAPTLDGNEPDKAPSVQAVNEGLGEKVGFTDYATSSKAGVVKVSQGSATNIGVNDGLIRVLKATENHITDRGADYTDYVLTASKTNAIVKAALTDQNKMALADNEKASARETLGAASAEEVDAIRAELGKQVFTVSQGQYLYGNEGWYVPNGALPNFYLETTLLEYSYEVDGVYAENFAKGNFTKLTFYDENDKVLDTKPATSQTFYEMPSGTAKIHHNGVYLDYNPPWDYAVMHLPDLKFQVKVGV